MKIRVKIWLIGRGTGVGRLFRLDTDTDTDWKVVVDRMTKKLGETESDKKQQDSFGVFLAGDGMEETFWSKRLATLMMEIISF